MDLQRREREARGRWPQGCPGSTPGACVVDELEVGLRPLALALAPLDLRKLLDLPRWLSYRAALNVASVALGKTHCSSKMEKIPMG